MAFSKTENIFFENVIEGFDPNNITAKNVSIYNPSSQAVERSGLTVRRPSQYRATSSTGLDVSSDYKTLSELTVPVSLADSNIINHAFTLSAHDRNDPMRLRKASDAAVQKLSSELDTNVQEAIKLRGSIVTAETGQYDTYAKLSKGDTALSERESGAGAARHLILNPRMANFMASDIAGRNNLDGRPLTTYERATLPPVAGFNTLRSNVIQTLAAGSAATITVNGANQGKIPIAFDSDTAVPSGSVADARFSVLAVSTAHGLVAGDCFTLALVNSVGMISKKNTGQLQTFRVISVATNDLTISPAIIPADGAAEAQKMYATCSTTPATGAALTVINTDASNPSVFYEENAVEIFTSQLDTNDLGSNVDVTSETTDSGITILFARQGTIDDLSAKYRLTFWAKGHVLEPQKAGIYLPGQNAAVG